MKRATLLLLACLPACAWNGQNATGPRITIEELAGRIKSGSAPAILDVRSDGEFKEGHVPGAIHIHYSDLDERLDELPIKKDGELVVYCAVGLRAGWAEKTLAKAGYTNVRDLDGQWNGWEESEHPVEKDE